MKNALKVSIAAAALLAAALPGLGSTSVTGIPGDCKMSVWRASVDATGKPTGEPTLLAENQMVGNWTPRAFRRSWDGKTVLAHTFEGFRVSKGADALDYKVQFLHRNFWWGPDSKHFLMWLPAGVAVANLDGLGAAGSAPRYKLVYRPQPGHFPFGIAWAPSGTDVLVSEHQDVGGATKTAILKVPAEGGAARPILEHPVEVLFYMAADATYEDGSGAKAKTAPIVFGARDGLYVMDGEGQNKRKLADVPCEGVADVIWDPSGKERFLLLFRRAFTSASKKTFQGLYLVHADKKGAKEDELFEQITDATAIHSLFTSPRGKYVGWATPDAVFYRELAKAGTPSKVELGGASGPVKGFAWDDAEKHVAVATGAQLIACDLASKATSVVAKAGDRTFVAEPFWRGDEIVYATYTDVIEKKKLEEQKK